MLELNSRLGLERDQLARIFQSAPAGILRIELDGAIADLNPAFEQIVGRPKPAVVGQRFWDLGPPDEVEATRARLASVAAGVRQEVAHARFLHHSGELVLTNLDLALVRDEAERPQFVIAVIEDVTERTRLELQLRLAQKLESVGRLAAGIAHEINTPIQFVGDHTSYLSTAVTNLIDLCVDYRSLCDKAAAEGLSAGDRARLHAQDLVLAHIRKTVPEAVEATLDGVGRVERIVQAMRTFAHPARGQRREADVNAALRSTLTVAANELKYVAVVDTDLQPLPPVPCFLSDLNQVFLNLLVNAAHAVADVVGKSGARGKVTVRSYREGDEAVVSISDTGTGIAPEIRDKIFDPFFTTKDVGRGTGHGLALARSVVVDQHRGALTFETEVGKGTTFFVRLPLLAESAELAVQ
jgi:PAS domain S-box-containing protein